MRVAAACQDRQWRPVAVCKCPEARAWALPYMATALAIPSRDLDRGSASSLQLNSLLFVFVWRHMKINI